LGAGAGAGLVVPRLYLARADAETGMTGRVLEAGEGKVLGLVRGRCWGW
jgi:hypothetical protein